MQCLLSLLSIPPKYLGGISQEGKHKSPPQVSDAPWGSVLCHYTPWWSHSFMGYRASTAAASSHTALLLFWGTVPFRLGLQDAKGGGQFMAPPKQSVGK